MSDDGRLREKARRGILAGTLPERGPDRMWGRKGLGVPCVVCETPVKPDEPEVEMEYASDSPAGSVTGGELDAGQRVGST
jgi:hypothetical protein